MAIARPPPVPAVMPRWRDKERRYMKRHAEWHIATAFWRRSAAAGRGPGARHCQAAVVGVRIAHRVRQSAGGWNVSAFGRWTVTGPAGRSTPPRARVRCGSVAEVPRIRARTRRGAAAARAWPRWCSQHACLDSQDGVFAREPPLPVESFRATAHFANVETAMSGPSSRRVPPQTRQSTCRSEPGQMRALLSSDGRARMAAW